MRLALCLLFVAMPLVAQDRRNANTAVDAVKANWLESQDYLVRSAEQMPESLYAFKPTPAVRSFGQIVAHVAGSQYLYCSMVLGQAAPRDEEEVEKNATTKAAIVQVIKDAGAYCARAYAVNDAAADVMIDVFGTRRTKLYALVSNAVHNMQHYGNLITYFRIKGMVPPSSQPR